MEIEIFSWFIIIICCIATVEILLISKLFLTVRDMVVVYQKIFLIIRSNIISDHWKEKVLPAYARLIFRRSLSLVFTLIFIFSPFIAAVFITAPFNFNISTILSSPAGLIGTTFFAVLYGFVRGRYGKK
ncbi:MAG TPA: hypothetical protein PK874_10425 [Desulfobacteraceae bacterium]|nr:hypothetical protein [Desulfobacteraceae bacterium]HPJ68627.1 hypothetical protein [Desulfobacteraceae bacterium]HPQ27534.1 hypothetical protein [Desulfobacteraceae bacterium]